MRFLTFLRGDEGDGRIVPPAGLTGHLTMFSAAAMSFLAVFALILTVAATRLADHWEQALAGTATVRVTAPDGQMEAYLGSVLAILQTTDGVVSTRALELEEQEALLVPWLGNDLPLDNLTMPRLVEVEIGPDGIDELGLNLRLEAEAPGAVFDDHTRWRAPLAQAAVRLKFLGWGAILLIGLTMAAVVALSSKAALAASRQEIDVLHLVGAEDRYIARAFVWRFTGRAVAGALVGTAVGVLAVFLVPDDPAAGSFLTGLHPNGAGWLLPLMVPPFAAAVAYVATRFTVLRLLKGTM